MSELHAKWPTQWFVGLQNVAHRLQASTATRPLARAIELALRLVLAATLPSETKIHRTVHFGHSALGVVLNRLCVIEEHCLIGSHVVLGGNGPLRGAPYIEAFATIHAGAKVIGPVRIGRGAVIGVNAVVTKDIPPFSVAVGVPARVIKTLPNSADAKRQVAS